MGGEKNPRHAVIAESQWRIEGMTERGQRVSEISKRLKATGERQSEVGKWAMTQL